MHENDLLVVLRNIFMYFRDFCLRPLIEWRFSYSALNYFSQIIFIQLVYEKSLCIPEIIRNLSRVGLQSWYREAWVKLLDTWQWRHQTPSSLWYRACHSQKFPLISTKRPKRPSALHMRNQFRNSCENVNESQSVTAAHMLNMSSQIISLCASPNWMGKACVSWKCGTAGRKIIQIVIYRLMRGAEHNLSGSSLCVSDYLEDVDLNA